MIAQAKRKAAGGLRAPQDYNRMKLSPPETVLSFLLYAAAGMVLLYIFYQNVFVMLIGACLGLLGPRFERGRRVRKRKQQLSVQFKDMLFSLSAALSAGRTALSHSMHIAYQDLQKLYFDPDTLILVEMRQMINRIESGTPVAEAFMDLAARSHDEDILSFANILSSTLDSGADLNRLIKRTTNVISEKIEVKQEIRTAVASMQLEQKIMCAMPVGLMLLINVSAKDYMAPLYAEPMGYVLITVALALLGVAVWVSGRVMNIKL